jgi:hypothetical protein
MTIRPMVALSPSPNDTTNAAAVNVTTRLSRICCAGAHADHDEQQQQQDPDVEVRRSARADCGATDQNTGPKHMEPAKQIELAQSM